MGSASARGLGGTAHARSGGRSRRHKEIRSANAKDEVTPHRCTVPSLERVLPLPWRLTADIQYICRHIARPGRRCGARNRAELRLGHGGSGAEGLRQELRLPCGLYILYRLRSCSALHEGSLKLQRERCTCAGLNRAYFEVSAWPIRDEGPWWHTEEFTSRPGTPAPNTFVLDPRTPANANLGIQGNTGVSIARNSISGVDAVQR